MTTKKNEFRIERDHLGEVQIPVGALWGILTARAQENLAVSRLKVHPQLIAAIVLVKKAAALTNRNIERLPGRLSQAICQAADEVLNGQWHDHFIVYSLQPSTVLVNNVNEVLANRASELLGETAGTYSLIHPLKHVSLGQSTNDVFISSMRLAILSLLQDLEPILVDTERLLRRKSLEFGRIVKIGRAHLQDAVPITMGQEFNAYGSSIERSCKRIVCASQSLLEINLGGTELGTGFNAHPAYLQQAVDQLAGITGFSFKTAEDYFRVTQSMADFAELSSSLKELAVELTKIANDLRLMHSGPKGGLAEISLPNVEPESMVSGIEIIPRSVKPTLTECVNMICFQVMGNDLAVTLSAQAGQLDLNAMMPAIIHNILQSLDLLTQTLQLFNKKCLAAINVNVTRCQELLGLTAFGGMLLKEHIGYEKTAFLIQESLVSGKSIRQLVLEHGLLPESDLDAILQYKRLTSPSTTILVENDKTETIDNT